MLTRESIPYVESILEGEEDNSDIGWDEDELPADFSGEEDFSDLDSSDAEERPDIPIQVDAVTGELLFDGTDSHSDRLDNCDDREGEDEVYVAEVEPVIEEIEDGEGEFLFYFIIYVYTYFFLFFVCFN